jgi:cell division transport system permease protein
MSRWLRQQRYALAVALRRLYTQPFSSLANIAVIALSLAIPIIAASILESAQPVVRKIPVSPEVTLFLKQETTLDHARALQRALQADYGEDIASIRVVSRTDALQALQQSPAWKAALSALPSNPLPDAVVVTLKETGQLAERAAALEQRWQTLDGVDSVQLDSEWVRRLDALLGFVRAGLGLLAAGVALVILATIFNTVRMQALTQREEIGVARLVGATEAFVRRPFLYLGALTGLLASAAAVGLAFAALLPLNAALGRLASSYGTSVTLSLPNPLNLALATAIVCILAAVAARWSVTRNTRF